MGYSKLDFCCNVWGGGAKSLVSSPDHAITAATFDFNKEVA